MCCLCGAGVKVAPCTFRLITLSMYESVGLAAVCTDRGHMWGCVYYINRDVSLCVLHVMWKNTESAPIVLDLPYVERGAAKPKAQMRSDPVEKHWKARSHSPVFSALTHTAATPAYAGGGQHAASGQKTFLPVHFEIRRKKKHKTIKESNKQRGEMKRKMANKNER